MVDLMRLGGLSEELGALLAASLGNDCREKAVPL